MTLPWQCRIQRPEAVLVRELGAESVLLNLDTESYFGLDEIGTRMWAVLVSAPSLEAAFEILVDEYEVDPQELRKDLVAFVERLVEARLVELEHGKLGPVA